MVKKTVSKKVVVKKAVAKANKARKTPVATPKASIKKTKAPVTAAKGSNPAKKTPAPVVKPRPVVKSPLDKKSLLLLKDALIKMRDRLTGQITALSDDSLKYIDDASSEDRTDDFDREFALNLVSSEHDSVYEINNALRRIEEGTYGLCDGCGCAIDKTRLQALPFARMCVRCQSEQERGRTRFRPFGDTLAQGVEQSSDVVEQEETE